MFCERVILCIRIIPGANVFVNAIGKEKKRWKRFRWSFGWQWLRCRNGLLPSLARDVELKPRLSHAADEGAGGSAGSKVDSVLDSSDSPSVPDNF